MKAYVHQLDGFEISIERIDITNHLKLKFHLNGVIFDSCEDLVIVSGTIDDQKHFKLSIDDFSDIQVVHVSNDINSNNSDHNHNHKIDKVIDGEVKLNIKLIATGYHMNKFTMIPSLEVYLKVFTLSPEPWKPLLLLKGKLSFSPYIDSPNASSSFTPEQSIYIDNIVFTRWNIIYASSTPSQPLPSHSSNTRILDTTHSVNTHQLYKSDDNQYNINPSESNNDPAINTQIKPLSQSTTQLSLDTQHEKLVKYDRNMMGMFVNGWNAWSYTGTILCHETRPLYHMPEMYVKAFHDGSLSLLINQTNTWLDTCNKMMYNVQSFMTNVIRVNQNDITTRHYMILENNYNAIHINYDYLASDMFTILFNKWMNTNIVIGFLSQHQQYGCISTNKDFNMCSIHIDCDHINMTKRPRHQIETDWLYIEINSHSQEDPLAQYFDITGKYNRLLLTRYSHHKQSIKKCQSNSLSATTSTNKKTINGHAAISRSSAESYTKPICTSTQNTSTPINTVTNSPPHPIGSSASSSSTTLVDLGTPNSLDLIDTAANCIDSAEEGSTVILVDPIQRNLEEIDLDVMDTEESGDPDSYYYDASLHPPGGWCSWYHYFMNINSVNLKSNVTQLADIRRHVHIYHKLIQFNLFQIDDGYQQAWGDWLKLDTIKFPHQSMLDIIQEIKCEGLKPGIWLAPFSCDKHSILVKEHPEWIISAPYSLNTPANSANCGKWFYGLDITLPPVQDYIREVLTTMINIWGFHYLKLDFLYAGILRSGQKVHNPTLTRAEVMQLGMNLIRDSVALALSALHKQQVERQQTYDIQGVPVPVLTPSTPHTTTVHDIFLLGCGAPLGSVIGHVQANRISADAGLSWLPEFPLPYSDEWNLPCARNMIRNTINRMSMHNRWWINDPDCLLLRTTTSFTDAEIRSISTVKAFSGGSFIISDDLMTLPESRLSIIPKLLPCTNQSSIVVDFLDKSMPEILRLDLKPLQQNPFIQSNNIPHWSLLAVCNWDSLHNRSSTGSSCYHQLSYQDIGIPHMTYNTISSNKAGIMNVSETNTHIKINQTGSLEDIGKEKNSVTQYVLHMYEFWTGSYECRIVFKSELYTDKSLPLNHRKRYTCPLGNTGVPPVELKLSEGFITLGPVPYHSAQIYAIRVQVLSLPTPPTSQSSDITSKSVNTSSMDNKSTVRSIFEPIYLGSNIHFTCGKEIQNTLYDIISNMDGLTNGTDSFTKQLKHDDHIEEKDQSKKFSENSSTISPSSLRSSVQSIGVHVPIHRHDYEPVTHINVTPISQPALKAFDKMTHSHTKRWTIQWQEWVTLQVLHTQELKYFIMYLPLTTEQYTVLNQAIMSQSTDTDTDTDIDTTAIQVTSDTAVSSSQESTTELNEQEHLFPPSAVKKDTSQSRMKAINYMNSAVCNAILNEMITIQPSVMKTSFHIIDLIHEPISSMESTESPRCMYTSGVVCKCTILNSLSDEKPLDKIPEITLLW